MIRVVYDATGMNVSRLPGHAYYAGYVTGSGGIPWTAAEWNGHPGAIRIDQTPAATQWDDTADVDDYERGAVSLSELAPRAKARIAAFNSGKRPGQREPAVYASQSNISAVVNALLAGGVKSGVHLWVANWSFSEANAAALVNAASGPFPIAGVQFQNAGAYDISVFSSDWMDKVSGGTPPPVPVPTPPPVHNSATIPVPVPIVLGDRGNHVRAVQALIGPKRNHPITIDGIFGPQTLALVKGTQRACHITVDGIVGPVTWNAIVNS